jgi:hypothetical protein
VVVPKKIGEVSGANMTIHHDEPLDLGTSSSASSSIAFQSPRGARAPGAAVRWALVQRVRSQIAAGLYLTSERWDATLDRVARAFTD